MNASIEERTASAENAGLKELLVAWRRRIDRSRHGLPPARSRARRGLRREDVAELLDVSPLWYALFESGRSRRRFSHAFLLRLADVLELTSAERDTLVELTVLGGHAAHDVATAYYRHRLDAVSRALVACTCSRTRVPRF